MRIPLVNVLESVQAALSRAWLHLRIGLLATRSPARKELNVFYDPDQHQLHDTRNPI
jgi:hypothetical protein